MTIRARYHNLLPSSLSDWLVLSGFVSYLLWILVRGLVPVEVLDPATFDSPVWRLGNSLGVTGLVVAAATLIIDGIRSMRRVGLSWKAATAATTGLLVCLTFATGGVVMSRALGNLAETFTKSRDTSHLASLSKVLSRQDLPLEKRAIVSKIYAAERYRQDGVLVDYITSDGTSARFEPSALDIRLRRLESVVPPLLAKSASHLRMAPGLWIVVALSSVALGLISPVRVARVS